VSEESKYDVSLGVHVTHVRNHTIDSRRLQALQLGLMRPVAAEMRRRERRVTT